MALGRVVIASGDEWIARLVGAGLEEVGFAVDYRNSAEECLTFVAANRVLAALCDMHLPDQDGSWLISEIRQIAPLTVCFLMAHADDTFSRVEGFKSGADSILTKPFRVAEAVLQVQALVRLVDRARGEAPPKSAPRSTSSVPGGHAIEGDIAHLSLPSVLSMLELERRTGVVVVKGAKQTASVRMQGGAAVEATLGGAKTSPIAVLRRMLRWKTGRFSFKADQEMPPPSNQQSIGAMLIEAARLDDELASDEDGTPPPSSALGDDGLEWLESEAPVESEAETTRMASSKRAARRTMPPAAGTPAVRPATGAPGATQPAKTTRSTTPRPPPAQAPTGAGQGAPRPANAPPRPPPPRAPRPLAPKK